MKKIISLWAALFAFFAVSSFVSAAQDSLNAFADGILGDYEVSHQGECSKVRITKENDGTYTVRVFWVQDRLDKKAMSALMTRILTSPCAMLSVTI